ncbi:MAG: hypothetical protein LBG12_07240 [Synergistaceae bacterium]|jgi:hypothetical protein|nr:hypothetical protein [Synergistaceae bacterium]
MAEFKTLTFPNTPKGQEQKIQELQKASEEGWEVVSETITQGTFKGKKACCLAFFFLPCGFCAGSTEGTINVTLKRE